MGMYTELIFGARLHENTPPEIIETCKYLFDIDHDKSKVIQDFCDMRNPVNGSGSYYFGVIDPVAKMWFDKISKAWHLSSRCNIKNYEDEIETFLDWIKPHIADGSGMRDMYAIVMYEESAEPEIHYLED
jgi:hypothetical protein